MSRLLKLLAPLAVLQMAMPAPAQASYIMVAACGGAGGMVPIRVPGRDDGGKNLPCCKICHISMRKRLAADSCCDEEDDPDVA
ncbi:hypothetical protein Saro_2570 [Novosphingobium aromaticivorans DSM 12444]|uniref:Uncharacterized protein n=1 Tax=Novosphingobium aromaticivorans (strain ATCC 700278 / DSM 12444 / CCUG 56034 / CIP 105152 / NBRC 16084 / F199) TaxID=279238 RepID=Q2G567_NOVAD|nr:hypothetical protein [Novosphingobium aromaticivorans]ABD27006.1 hypothetical protein Saro_2570 [Novosphingobium aromaticivorans DSM 12444]SCY47736.1 hypothetical protein SAMN05660666_01825 [Novosphingobium aromaticivorans]